jgi:lipoate-protein ligase B
MAVFVQLEGLTPYADALALMDDMVRARIDGRIGDTVLTLEHPPVITLGRKRTAANSVRPTSTLPVIEVARGGDAALHAPGQLVAWPILLLDGDRRDLIRHLRALEQAVIELLFDLGLQGHRDERNTGVWLPCPDGASRKACAIGVGAKRWVTTHGLALNLTVERSWFEHLAPCGLPPDTVTRLADHLDPCPSPADLAPNLSPYLARALGVSFEAQWSAPTVAVARDGMALDGPRR